jgi:hypothetical protein
MCVGVWVCGRVGVGVCERWCVRCFLELWKCSSVTIMAALILSFQSEIRAIKIVSWQLCYNCVYVCVLVCVCQRERDIERERERIFVCKCTSLHQWK